MEMSLEVLYKTGDFLTTGATVSLWVEGEKVLCGVYVLILNLGSAVWI